MTPVEIMLKTSLVAVPAFMRVEPVRTSGPVTGVMAMSRVAGDGRIGDAGEADGERAQRAGVDQRAQDVGRASAGGDSDQGVGAANLAAARSRSPSSGESSECSEDLRRAASPPAMIPCTSVGGTENVGGHSEASSTPRRPLVPAPM